MHPCMRPFPPTLYPGVRSLLSRMVHHAGGASPGANGGSADSFDLVNLCSTFGSDPSITSFAQVRPPAGVGGRSLGELPWTFALMPIHYDHLVLTLPSSRCPCSCSVPAAVLRATASARACRWPLTPSATSAGEL